MWMSRSGRVENLSQVDQSLRLPGVVATRGGVCLEVVLRQAAAQCRWEIQVLVPPPCDSF